MHRNPRAKVLRKRLFSTLEALRMFVCHVRMVSTVNSFESLSINVLIFHIKWCVQRTMIRMLPESMQCFQWNSHSYSDVRLVCIEQTNALTLKIFTIFAMEWKCSDRKRRAHFHLRAQIQSLRCCYFVREFFRTMPYNTWINKTWINKEIAEWRNKNPTVSKAENKIIRIFFVCVCVWMCYGFHCRALSKCCTRNTVCSQCVKKCAYYLVSYSGEWSELSVNFILWNRLYNVYRVLYELLIAQNFITLSLSLSLS